MKTKELSIKDIRQAKSCTSVYISEVTGEAYIAQSSLGKLIEIQINDARGNLLFKTKKDFLKKVNEIKNK